MRTWQRVGAVAAFLTAAACSDATSPLAGKGQSVSLSFMSTTPTGGVMSVESDSVVVTSGADRLVITSVELVLRKIELERASASVNCDSTANEDACEEFTLGTMLVSLPLGTGTAVALSVPIDSGTYSSLHFKIHKPGNDSVDSAFHLANPSWPATTSIRVTGTFNGTPFTYTSPMDVEQESVFSPALVVDASGSSTNVTIRADVSKWFVNGSGALISPATGTVGQPNESVVNENIKNSFKAFKDRDHDGHEGNG